MASDWRLNRIVFDLESAFLMLEGLFCLIMSFCVSGSSGYPAAAANVGGNLELEIRNWRIGIWILEMRRGVGTDNAVLQHMPKIFLLYLFGYPDSASVIIEKFCYELINSLSFPFL